MLFEMPRPQRTGHVLEARRLQGPTNQSASATQPSPSRRKRRSIRVKSPIWSTFSNSSGTSSRAVWVTSSMRSLLGAAEYAPGPSTWAMGAPLEATVRVMGIDEAGRGCVLGPLVIAGFLVDDVDPTVLTAAGARDSKAVSAKKRWAAREALAPLGIADVRTVSCAEIDAGNLNQLEEAVIAELVKHHKPDHVIVDALGHPSTLPAVQQRLTELCEHDCTWLIVPKADRDHPVVGAASMFAKTTRDQLLEESAEVHGVLGSGYPSDPKTRAWISAWAQTGKPWPDFVRTRWQTVKDLAQQSLL